MELIRTTKTGAYYRMDDGRIGYANHQYARVSVKREGLRDGKYYRYDNKISDRAYQINKCKLIPSQWGMMKERIKYNSKEEAIQALTEYNNKNCNEIAQLKSQRDLYKSFYKGHRLYNESRYNNGFSDGVHSIEDKLVKLLNNL